MPEQLDLVRFEDLCFWLSIHPHLLVLLSIPSLSCWRLRFLHEFKISVNLNPKGQTMEPAGPISLTCCRVFLKHVTGSTYRRSGKPVKQGAYDFFRSVAALAFTPGQCTRCPASAPMAQIWGCEL